MHGSRPPQGFSLRQLQHLVLDEADRILSLDFEEDIDKILKARRMPAVAMWHVCAARTQPETTRLSQWLHDRSSRTNAARSCTARP